MSTIIEIKNLTVDKKLNNINLSIEQGTLNVIIGNSGKTTLVKAIMGLIEYSGTISYNGSLITQKNQKDIIKNIGYFRNNMLKNETVKDNIIYPLINLDLNEIEAKKKVYDICSRFKISDLLLKNINTLTHTEKKIISFIVSIIHNPKVLIIDDSIEDLDELNKNKILDYINKSKLTCIYLTNNESEILNSDNLIIIENGKLIDSGKTEEILKKEKIFKNIGLPFLIDLSNKLKVYGLVDKIYLDTSEMIEDIWK